MNISLILPCYNEEANLQKGVLDKIGNYVQGNTQIKEVIIVDDGSTDSSRKIIKEKYLSQFSQFRLVENKHQGKALAVIAGIEESKEGYVIFSDIDLATPIEEAEKLIQEAEHGYEIVIGSRSSSREGAPLLRKIMAVGFIIIRNASLGLGTIKDTQCGFKLFQRKVALHIIQNLKVFSKDRTTVGSSVSAGFDLEFLFLAQKFKYKIKEVPVTWRHVETKNVRFVKDVVETLRDMTKIKYYDLTGKYES